MGMNGISNGGMTNFSQNSIGFYSNISQMNNAKLNQILAKKTGQSAPGAGASLNSGTANFLKDYQKNMSAMMNKANSMREMNPTGAFSNLEASSGDSAVLEAEAYYRLTEPAQYDVSVEQLAMAQKTSTTGVSADAAASLSGQFTISSGEKTISINTDSLKGSTNAQQLGALATEINRYKGGVTAKVVTNDGKASLEITGAKTGENNGFALSGAAAQQLGAQTSQKAQNAKYTVDGKAFSSDSNTVNVGGYKVFATLKKEGATSVNVAPDSSKMLGQVQELVDSFNSSLRLLNNNSSRGSGVLRQMKRMVSPPTSEKSLELAGISINKDGTLKLDKGALEEAMKKNPSLIKEVISGKNGLAEGIYNDARAGLNTSSASLVNEDMRTQKPSFAGSPQNQPTDAMNFMNTYSRSGAYNMTNYYAVGAMMNFYI